MCLCALNILLQELKTFGCFDLFFEIQLQQSYLSSERLHHRNLFIKRHITKFHVNIDKSLEVFTEKLRNIQ